MAPMYQWMAVQRVYMSGAAAIFLDCLDCDQYGGLFIESFSRSCNYNCGDAIRRGFNNKT